MWNWVAKRTRAWMRRPAGSDFACVYGRAGNCSITPYRHPITKSCRNAVACADVASSRNNRRGQHAIPVLGADDCDVRPVAGRRGGCAGAVAPAALKRNPGRSAGVSLFQPRNIIRNICTTSFAIFARREVAAVDRLLEERLLAVGPELADVRIGLDHRVPELVLVVAEQLLLLDLLDVDVLDRVAHVVEADRAARRLDLERRHLLH